MAVRLEDAVAEAVELAHDFFRVDPALQQQVAVDFQRHLADAVGAKRLGCAQQHFPFIAFDVDLHQIDRADAGLVENLRERARGHRLRVHPIARGVHQPAARVVDVGRQMQRRRAGLVRHRGVHDLGPADIVEPQVFLDHRNEAVLRFDGENASRRTDGAGALDGEIAFVRAHIDENVAGLQERLDGAFHRRFVGAVARDIPPVHGEGVDPEFPVRRIDGEAAAADQVLDRRRERRRTNMRKRRGNGAVEESQRIVMLSGGHVGSGADAVSIPYSCSLGPIP